MLDRCKEILFKNYNSEEKKGIFMSGFTQERKLIFSQGVVETDTILRESLETIYKTYGEKYLDQIAYIVIDIVTDIITFPDANKVFDLDPTVYGLIIEDLEDDNVGIILPNIAGVTDMKQVLYDLKKKYGIHGKASVSGFTTTRILITK